MECQSGLSELSVISVCVSAFQGCPLSRVPLYILCNNYAIVSWDSIPHVTITWPTVISSDFVIWTCIMQVQIRLVLLFDFYSIDSRVTDCEITNQWPMQLKKPIPGIKASIIPRTLRPVRWGGSGGSDEPPTLWWRSAGVNASAWRLATLHDCSKRSGCGRFQVGPITFSQTKHAHEELLSRAFSENGCPSSCKFY